MAKPKMLDNLFLPYIKLRGSEFARWLGKYIPRNCWMLDLGSGHGLTGQSLALSRKAMVTAVDREDYNLSPLPFSLAAGQALPFADGQFDVVLLLFVLHHSIEPEKVLGEAQRVCRDQIIVLEDALVRGLQGRATQVIDWFGNFRSQEGYAHHRPREEWRRLFQSPGWGLVVEEEFRSATSFFLLSHCLFVLSRDPQPVALPRPNSFRPKASGERARW